MTIKELVIEAIDNDENVFDEAVRMCREEGIEPDLETIRREIDEEQSRRSERAWERFCEDYYGGDGPQTLREQAEEARKLK